MTVVASGVSPLNCRWIKWHDTLPVCTRPPEPPHPVSESECAICDFWSEREEHAASGAAMHDATGRPAARATNYQDPLTRETCPRCNSHDVVLMQRDALVQSFSCTICHQRWLATRPWPLLRETRSRQGEP